MKKFLLLILFLLVIGSVYADEISIESVFSSPREVAPGEDLQVSIDLRNVGTRDIENVAVKLDLTQVPFAPLDSSTEFVIKEINKKDTENILFNIVALPNASPGVYKIPIHVSYENISKDALISLTIQAKPQLLVELETSDILYKESSGIVTINFVNKGLSDIKFLTVTLEQSSNYEIIGSDTVYIGDIDIDDSQTADFNIYLNGNGELPLTLEYRDANNNLYIDNQIISFNVYTKEEAEKLGLVKKSNSLIYLIVIVVILVAIFLFRRLRRKK